MFAHIYVGFLQALLFQRVAQWLRGWTTDRKAESLKSQYHQDAIAGPLSCINEVNVNAWYA